MGRSPCCDADGLKKGPWTPQEDQKLLAYIEKHGHGNWSFLPQKAGLQRCGKSCRLRWINYLRPDIKRGKFTIQEDRSIIQLHALLGNRWSAIAAHLPKRTDNEIKNYWNTHLKKRLAMMGIDPVTHKPKRTTLASPSGDPKTASILSHMAQWESARLQAEARLGRDSNLKLLNNINSIMSLNYMTSTISSSSSATEIPLGYHFNGFLGGGAASCVGDGGGGGGDINEVIFANESSIDIAAGWINMEARSDINGEGFMSSTCTSNVVFNNFGMQALPTTTATTTTTNTTAAAGGGVDAITGSDHLINDVDLYIWSSQEQELLE